MTPQEQDNAVETLPRGRYGRGLLKTAAAVAIVGGVLLLALVIMSIVSIVGRKLFSLPIPGDVELLQLFAAASCACFFAYCHLMAADVKVDFFTQHLRARRTLHIMDAFGSLLLSLFGALLFWRTFASVLTIKASGETTVILGFPLWIGQSFMLPGFLLFALAGLYQTSRYLRRAYTNRDGLERDSQGAPQ